jgi:hypothetical protein
MSKHSQTYKNYFKNLKYNEAIHQTILWLRALIYDVFMTKRETNHILSIHELKIVYKYLLSVSFMENLVFLKLDKNNEAKRYF